MDFIERVEFFRGALGFEGLTQGQLEGIAEAAFSTRFVKGEIIFDQNDRCERFHAVAKGLVKVSICSPSGFRMTYLIARPGEPLNLVGPFIGSPRTLSAEAMEDSVVVCMKRQDFTAMVFKNPVLITNIISILGHALDSANSRMIDMLEKRVDQRLLRVLYTLNKKFGAVLNFTSSELAELAGTTGESTLRAMGRLRRMGIVETGRGVVRIVEPDKLENLGSDTFWL
jgi:CRP-like cAMP-binding protein